MCIINPDWWQVSVLRVARAEKKGGITVSQPLLSHSNLGFQGILGLIMPDVPDSKGF